MRSAPIEWLDRERVLAEARELAAEMKAAHPEVRRVLLFGSLAKGGDGPRSDLDLVVLLENTDLAPRERSAQYRPISSRPVDLFVYTEAEVARFRRCGAPPPLREALEEGLDLLEG